MTAFSKLLFLFFLSSFFSKKERDYVFMKIRIGELEKGEMVFELFNDIVPKTAENFKQLCLSKKEGFGYKNCPFHRIIRGFMAQGGDFTNRNGTGGKSIYGNKFEDENFIMGHKERGMLSMANAGPNTNGSQFFITFQKTDYLDGKHVVFGKLVKGFEVLDEIEKQGMERNNNFKKVTISDCGSYDNKSENDVYL